MIAFLFKPVLAENLFDLSIDFHGVLRDEYGAAVVAAAGEAVKRIGRVDIGNVEREGKEALTFRRQGVDGCERLREIRGEVADAPDFADGGFVFIAGDKRDALDWFRDGGGATFGVFLARPLVGRR